MSNKIELTMAFSLSVNIALPRVGNEKPVTIKRHPTVLELAQMVRDMHFLAIQLKGEILEHSVKSGERRFKLTIPANQETSLRHYLLDNDKAEIILPKKNGNKKITWPNFIRFVPKI